MENTVIEITNKQVAEAVTNDPNLSDTVVTVGDKEYKVVYLPYKDQLKFYAGVMPLFEALGSKLSSQYGLPIAEVAEFTPASILKFCGDSLPELACIVLRQSDPSMTVDQVLAAARSPFQLANVALKQIEKNNMVSEIASFFASILPLVKTAMGQRMMTKRK